MCHRHLRICRNSMKLSGRQNMERQNFLLSWPKYQVLALVLLMVSSAHCFMIETEASQSISDKAREDTDLLSISDEAREDIKSQSLADIAREHNKYMRDSCKCTENPTPTDCDEVRRNGHTASGVYNIFPKSRFVKCETMKVYCDMETEGEGWTVIQRRGNFGNALNFFSKSWDKYKKGFGDLKQEFWLGNDNIVTLTNQASYTVKFELNHENGTSATAVYDTFWIEDEKHKYKLHIDDYSGNAGNAMSYHNDKEFYTKDQPGGNKPNRQNEGGWWHNVFPSTNLNGLNKYGMDNSGSEDGITWDPFGGYHTSMLSTEIKIRAI